MEIFLWLWDIYCRVRSRFFPVSFCSLDFCGCRASEGHQAAEEVEDPKCEKKAQATGSMLVPDKRDQALLLSKLLEGEGYFLSLQRASGLPYFKRKSMALTWPL